VPHEDSFGNQPVVDVASLAFREVQRFDCTRRKDHSRDVSVTARDE